MERIAINTNHQPDDPTAVEPHFNDERSIRAAQPVVPLETVVRERRRRLLMFGGAFIIACLLGSTAALALIRLRQSSIAGARTDTAMEAKISDEPEEQADPSTEPATALETASVTEPDVTEVNESQLPKPKKKSRKAATSPPLQVTVRTSPISSNEARMVDQWEERRQRRVSRPRDPQQNHHSDDLFRIREIFEGPRRPRRTNNQY